MIRETALGPFAWDGSCWLSEPIPVSLFGGAKVHVLMFGREDDAEVLAADEIYTLQRFLALGPEHGLAVVPHLWRYYLDMWENVGPPDIPEFRDPSTIWDHVAPRGISVERDEEGVLHVVVEAECDWEIEHGLQLVLREGHRWVRVSDYSGHLTDGHAWGKASLDDWIADPAETLPVRSYDDLCAAQDSGAKTDQRRFGLKAFIDILVSRFRRT